MKKSILLLFVLSTFSVVNAQEAYRYLNTARAVSLLASFAHVSGTYDNEGSSVSQGTEFNEVHIHYKGSDNQTVIRIYDSNGFFNGLRTVTDDGHMFGAFLASGTLMDLVRRLAAKYRPEDYQKGVNYMKTLLGTDPQNWNGADWALCFLNIDHLDFLTGGN